MYSQYAVLVIIASFCSQPASYCLSTMHTDCIDCPVLCSSVADLKFIALTAPTTILWYSVFHSSLFSLTQLSANRVNHILWRNTRLT